MILAYLNTLKTQGNFTIEQISRLSGIPEPTVKNIFSGKTGSSRMETVAPIIKAMGGSLDTAYGISKEEDIESNSIIAIKESYEQRIKNITEHFQQHHDDLQENYEKRLADKREIIESCNKHIQTLEKECRSSKIAFWICVAVFIAVLIVEVMNPDLGWIRY